MWWNPSEKTFFLYNGLKTIFAAVDIIIDKDDFGDYAFFEDNGELVNQNYNIHFAARKVRWQYMFIESGNDQMHYEHEIYDNSEGKNYEPVEEILLR